MKGRKNIKTASDIFEDTAAEGDPELLLDTEADAGDIFDERAMHNPHLYPALIALAAPTKSKASKAL